MNSAILEAEPKLKTEPAVKEELDIKDLQNIIVANTAEQSKALTTSAVTEETKDLSLLSIFQSILVRISSSNFQQVSNDYHARTKIQTWRFESLGKNKQSSMASRTLSD
jgi:hypothetical protein